MIREDGSVVNWCEEIKGSLLMEDALVNKNIEVIAIILYALDKSPHYLA